MVEFVGALVGSALTLLVFTYLLGDNPLYRLAIHLFVGALVGYSFGIVLRDVLIGMVLAQLLTNPVAVLLPLVLGILLLFKGFPKHAYVGNFAVAFLIGVGAAVALSGALLGTLVPQVGATGQALSPASRASSPMGLLDGLLILVGTVCTLMAFSFTPAAGSLKDQPEQPAGTQARRIDGLGLWAQLVRLVAGVGRIFLTFALGVALAAGLTASLSIFIGRIQYLIDVFSGFLH